MFQDDPTPSSSGHDAFMFMGSSLEPLLLLFGDCRKAILKYIEHKTTFQGIEAAQISRTS